MSRLDKKVAIVTGGGGSGIGGGISRILARRGGYVFILEIDLEAGEQVRRQIESDGGRAAVVRADVTRSTDVQNAVNRVIAQSGRLDILVNNAGIGLIRPVAEATEAEFDQMGSTDLRGLWLCCKYAIPYMQRQKQGSIINIASVHARSTLPFYGLYAGMKAGVVGLTRGIAVHYGADGIRANTVSPGLVDGEQTRHLAFQLSGDAESWLENFVRRHQSLHERIQPEDVGNLVAFLASDEARMITGADIPIDAGTLAQLTSQD